MTLERILHNMKMFMAIPLAGLISIASPNCSSAQESAYSMFTNEYQSASNNEARINSIQNLLENRDNEKFLTEQDRLNIGQVFIEKFRADTKKPDFKEELRAYLIISPVQSSKNLDNQMDAYIQLAIIEAISKKDGGICKIYIQQGLEFTKRTNKAAKAYHEIAEIIVKKDVREGMRLYQDAINAGSSNVLDYICAAKIYKSYLEYESAAKCLEMGIKLDPGNSEIIKEMGHLTEKLKKIKQGEGR